MKAKLKNPKTWSFEEHLCSNDHVLRFLVSFHMKKLSLLEITIGLKLFDPPKRTVQCVQKFEDVKQLGLGLYGMNDSNYSTRIQSSLKHYCRHAHVNFKAVDQEL